MGKNKVSLAGLKKQVYKMHLKRQKVPKHWPLHRKGTKYVVRPGSNMKTGIPVLVILRDMLKIVQNRKEAKKIIHAKAVLLNNKVIRDEKNSVLLFDVITIAYPKSRKNYELTLSDKGKFDIKELNDNEAGQKIVKIVNKKILKGKKVQLNFGDGRNILSDIKCKVNDSVLINFKDNKIEKCLELKERVRVMVIGGKHAGKSGVISKIDQEKRIVELNVGDKDKSKINVLIKHLIVVG